MTAIFVTFGAFPDGERIFAIDGRAVIPPNDGSAADRQFCVRTTQRAFWCSISDLYRLTLSAIGYLSLAGISQETPYTLVMVALIVIGIGMALTVLVLMDATEPTKAGIASGVFNTARQIDGVVGVGVFSSLLAGDGQDLVAGIRQAFAPSGSAMILAPIRIASRSQCLPVTKVWDG